MENKFSIKKSIWHIVLLLVITGIIHLSIGIFLGVQKKCPPLHRGNIGSVTIEFLCLSFTPLYDASPKFIQYLISRPKNTPSSFPGDVYILLLEDKKPIKDVEVQDVVVSFNIQTNQLETAKITQIFSRKDENFIKINNDLKVTSKHPLAVTNVSNIIQWKNAEDIALGDCLFSSLVECVEVTEVQTITEQSQTVYNVHVLGPENYYVLIDNVPILVHNKQVLPKELLK